jgi:hypothetical protein
LTELEGGKPPSEGSMEFGGRQKEGVDSGLYSRV